VSHWNGISLTSKYGNAIGAPKALNVYCHLILDECLQHPTIDLELQIGRHIDRVWVHLYFPLTLWSAPEPADEFDRD